MDKQNISEDEKYMRRCLQLALNGKGYVSPNPLVGAVVVHRGVIIGEGYHREYGKSHAEVNAINEVKDKSLLKDSIIYVSLEPCSHYGKTPPCSQLIIDSKIPKVVIATLDPYFEVAGRGVAMLRSSGIDVQIGVLEVEAQSLNKEFFISQIGQRPYIYLKWAQTSDGFIDKLRKEDALATPTPISNSLTRVLVHKFRSEVSAIMIATNTAIQDNPSLSTRFWYGKNPIRVVLDRKSRIPTSYKVYDKSVKTLFFTEITGNKKTDGNIEYIPLKFDENMILTILKELSKRKINSLLVEGGASLLQSFIDLGAWDEISIEVNEKSFVEGVKAPSIKDNILERKFVGNSEIRYLKNVYNYKIL